MTADRPEPATATPPGAGPTFNLADLFELVAAAVPHRTAVVAGDRRVTFAELDARTSQLARHLQANGATVGAKVAIYAWNRVEWLEAFLAAFKARTVPVNINYRYVADELRYVLDNADAETVIAERSFTPVLAAVRPDLPRLREVVLLDEGADGDLPGAVAYEAALAAQPAGPLGLPRSPDDVYMLYTGGTTGMPKGVEWRQEDLFFAALLGGGAGTGAPVTTPGEIVERIRPDGQAPVGLYCAPVMHGAAQWGVLITLLAGGTAVLYAGRGFDAVAAWRTAERERCSSIMLVGDAMARPLADALADPANQVDGSAVVSIGSGGAVFSPAVQDQLRALLPHVYIIDSFGASETGASGTSTGAGQRRFRMSPEMTVLDDELRPVAPGSGVVGRVARGGHIPLGYYKDPVKTAATFVTDGEGRRWVVPGDYATVEEDGTITVLGRGSQCINTGGEKVYPEEVEEALKSHPGVFDALVVGVPDDRFGERVAAVVAARPGAEVTLAGLAEHCRTRIAGYKVPRDLRLVDAVRRTPAGKADYRWAKDEFARP